MFQMKQKGVDFKLLGFNFVEKWLERWKKVEGCYFVRERIKGRYQIQNGEDGSGIKFNLFLGTRFD